MKVPAEEDGDPFHHQLTQAEAEEFIQDLISSADEARMTTHPDVGHRYYYIRNEEKPSAKKLIAPSQCKKMESDDEDPFHHQLTQAEAEDFIQDLISSTDEARMTTHPEVGHHYYIRNEEKPSAKKLIAPSLGKKMESNDEDPFHHQLTQAEAEDFIQDLISADEASISTHPDVGHHYVRNEEKPSVKQLIQEERLGHDEYDPTETMPPVRQPTAPPGITLLNVTLRTDSYPQHNLVYAGDVNTEQVLFGIIPVQPNTVYTKTRWIPDDGCTYLGVTDRKKDGLAGSGNLRVEYGSWVLYDGKGRTGSAFIYQAWLGKGCP